MRIDRVQLRNFRCFEDQSFRFADDFTLLIGANATGKSAVLDALAIAAGSALMAVPDAAARLIRRLDVRRSYPTGAEVGSFEEHYPAVVAAWGGIDGLALSWRRELRSPKSRTTYREANAVRTAMDELAHQSRSGAEVLFPCIAYYSTGRLWLEQREPKSGGMDPGGKTSRYAGYQNCLTPRSSTRRLVRQIKRLSLIQAQRGERLETLAAVLAAIANCVEGAASASFDFEEDDIAIVFEGGLRCPFRLLSDGQRTMAALAADIAMRCALLNPHLNGQASRETPGVVLIDELDLHLHPLWQRRVVGDLRRTFPNIQFIASSHSPFIIQSMEQCGGVINLDAGEEEPFELSHHSIEDVAEDIMRVELPQRSRRFSEMSQAAEEYFRAIEDGGDQDSRSIEELRRKLDRLQHLYADNPAYAAFLRMHLPPDEGGG